MALTGTFENTLVRLSRMAQTFRRQLWLPAILSMLILSSQTSALAEGRILQVLGVCGAPFADAQFVGNRKHGRTHLVSFGPTGFAGFFIEGLEGVKISNLATIFLHFAPPPEGTSTFVMRIKTDDKKVQNFTIGPDTDSALPNLPTDITLPDGSKDINIQRASLTGGKSQLTTDDTIAKVSFLFSCDKANSKQELFIDDVYYAAQKVSLVLDPITCNLR